MRFGPGYARTGDFAGSDAVSCRGRRLQLVPRHAKSPAGAVDAPAGLSNQNPYYCLTGAGTGVAGGGFSVFFTPFLLCFRWVFAGAVAAGLAAAPVAAGAGVCAAANVMGTVAIARAKVRMVVFILFFSLAGLVARSQFHTALCARETR